MNDHPSTTQSIIMDALSTLSSSQLSTLSHSLSSTFHRHNHHLATLLSSPPLFIHTLNHLYSLSLPQKSLLIARHLLSFLRLLSPFFSSSSPSSTSNRVRHCDLDSVLLLLFFCEVRQHHPTILDTHPTHWQPTLQHYKSGSDTILSLSTLTITPYQTLGAYIDLIVKYRRFVGSKGCSNERNEVATAVETVVALPSMEVPIGGLECVICKEEMKQGRDVCQLPCQHLFHWMCVLPWLNKRNTCPCCRFLLPTDDVYGEIERLWDTIVKVGSQRNC